MSKLLLRLNEVSFSYPGLKESLFKNITFSVYSGERIGLLGYNGSGKTTLLDIIMGFKEVDTGKVDRFYKKIFYLKQEDYAFGDMTVFYYLLSSKPKLFKMHKEMREMEQDGLPDPLEYSEIINEFDEFGGYEFLQLIEETIDLLGFPQRLMNHKVNTLSSGEKRLLKLASGFVNSYDCYLLDEPTNYFDDQGIQYLIKRINSSKETFLIVSHDRWFLDQTVHNILEIEQRTIKEYTGDYSTFCQTKQIELKDKMRKKEMIETEIAKLRETERTYRVWGKRKEKEKIGGGDKGFIGHRAAKLMKRAIQAKDRIRKKIADLEKSRPYIEKWYDFRFEPVKIHAGACLSVNGLTKVYPNRTLFSNLSFTVGWGEKVALVGPNGSGKTTLLKILLGKEPPDKGEVFWSRLIRVGYLAQQWEIEDDTPKVSHLFPKDQQGRARTLIGTLKVMVMGNVFNKRLGELSEGQKRKIKLAQIIISEPNILVLDEPTIQLDYQTVEILERVLQSFNGTVILVSHDTFLRKRVVTREIEIMGSYPYVNNQFSP